MFFEKTIAAKPLSEYSIYSKNLRQFFYWMFERQNIWYKRFALKQPRPWTKDNILNEFKFTNVYRQLDRNSIYLIEKVIKKKYSEKEMFWKIVVYRYFNKPELFDFIGGIPDYDKFNLKKFSNAVMDYKSKHGRVFTDAYLINPPRKKEDVKIGIERFYCNNVQTFHDRFTEIWKVYEKSKEPETFFTKLTELPQIANFIAYEIYCDLTYTKWFKYHDNDFVNVGPGAKFGLELLFPNLIAKKGRTRYKDKITFLRDNADKFFKLYGFENFKYYNESNFKDYKNGLRLGYRCIEHSLCEYQKYWKMCLDVGKPRQKFVPKTK